LSHHQNALFSGCFAFFMADTIVVTRLAAYEFFIQLDDAAKRRQLVGPAGHHPTDRMAHFPCGALFDSDQPAEKNR
jgi:hypothetical protein